MTTEPAQNEICLLDEVAVNASPAEMVRELDGWLLRYNQGAFRRSNSVWVGPENGKLALPEKIAAAEDFYRRLSSPALFQIIATPQSEELDGLLAERSYTVLAETLVQTADVARSLAQSSSAATMQVELSETCGEEWSATYCEGGIFPTWEGALRRGIFERIAMPRRFALLKDGQQPLATGLGVLERGQLGIYSMTTLPEARRQGCAGAILQALLQWGQQQGAQQAYLLVMEQNEAARALYEKLAFKTLYRYHYRKQRETG